MLFSETVRYPILFRQTTLEHSLSFPQKIQKHLFSFPQKNWQCSSASYMLFQVVRSSTALRMCSPKLYKYCCIIDTMQESSRLKGNREARGSKKPAFVPSRPKLFHVSSHQIRDHGHGYMIVLRTYFVSHLTRSEIMGT